MTISDPETGAHLDVNEMWMTALGYSREEAAKQSALELGIWAKPEKRQRFIEQVSRDGSANNLEATFRRKMAKTLTS
jgi:PAS domain-containing protein